MASSSLESRLESVEKELAAARAVIGTQRQALLTAAAAFRRTADELEVVTASKRRRQEPPEESPETEATAEVASIESRAAVGGEECIQ